MRIISLNIQHGGGRRDQSIIDWIFAHQPDVIVLSEWRNNATGARILHVLKQNNFFCAPACNEKANGLLIAAKRRFANRCITPFDSKNGQLLMAEDLFGCNLLGAYFPNKNAKAPFFKFCIEAATADQAAPFALVGDLNTGNNNVDRDADGMRFYCADLFEALSSRAGLIDLWRREHGMRLEWSWKSQKDNGFRIDHIFANYAFIRRFASIHCNYDEKPYVGLMSDHKGLVADCVEK